MLSANNDMKRNWWKYLSILLLLYAIIYGFTVRIPNTPIAESLRNVFYHVGMWFAMMGVLTVSFINSIRFLKTNDLTYDSKANEAVKVSFLFGILGLITGMVWAQFTWGEPWANDPHLNGAVITLVVYAAYMILRSAITDDEKRARVAAVLNIFAFVMMLMLLGLLPRLAENTVHPGSGGSEGGNPAFGDMDTAMRYVFYPAIAGWIMLGLWILNIRIRIKKLEQYIEDKDWE
jgi:heme exporter protein C